MNKKCNNNGSYLNSIWIKKKNKCKKILFYLKMNKRNLIKIYINNNYNSNNKFNRTNNNFKWKCYKKQIYWNKINKNSKKSKFRINKNFRLKFNRINNFFKMI